MNYEEGSLEQLQQKQEVLQRKRRDLRSKLDQLKAYRFEFQYQDPYPNFNRNSVKGRVCTLFEVKDQRDCLALSMMAGGSVSCRRIFAFLFMLQSFIFAIETSCTVSSPTQMSHRRIF